MTTSLLAALSPSITDLIRVDHAHVRSAYYQYLPSAPARQRKGLADHICLALEIHAQLEEEIFYPALQAASGLDVLDKALPEHMQLRTHIARLRALDADHPAFDESLRELMRQVMHHVADEETQLLAAAERHLASRLSELGARMTRRRLELAVPRAGELASSLARSIGSGALLGAAGAVFSGGALLARPRLATRWRQRNAGR